MKQCWIAYDSYYMVQGEELRKLIGAPAYIECSSKTQQVCHFFFATVWGCLVLIYGSASMCRMWKQFLMPPSKWCFNHPNRRKRRRNHIKLAPSCEFNAHEEHDTGYPFSSYCLATIWWSWFQCILSDGRLWESIRFSVSHPSYDLCPTSQACTFSPPTCHGCYLFDLQGIVYWALCLNLNHYKNLV